MTGETSLHSLLRSLAPSLMEGEFVFCTFPGANYGDHVELEPVAAFREREGLTLVVPKPRADQSGLEYSSVFRGITLNVHSSLDAVGLTAAISTQLAAQGISANVLAAYYHDHVFVPRELADSALEALEHLAESTL